MPGHSSKATHYIPYFTVERSAAYNPNGRPNPDLRAACGTWTRTADHDTEPTCPQCVAYLLAEAKDDAQLYADMGYVELRPGLFVPGPNAKDGPF